MRAKLSVFTLLGGILLLSIAFVGVVGLKSIVPENQLQESGEEIVYLSTEDYEKTVISAVESAENSVVSVIVSKDLPVIERCPYSPAPGFNFFVPCEKGTEKREVGGGSGFVVSPDGLVVTNKHVVADVKAEYTVLTNDGKKYEAQVLAKHPVLDIAVLKFIEPPKDLKPAKLGDSSTIRLGQTSIAIGNALGEFRNTVSVGVVSGLSRNITASGNGGSEFIEDLIQTDSAINPGNSGGPLLNLKGEVIGINTAVALDAQNVGFAIPINHAKRAIESVRRTGTISVPYLGVRYQMTEDGAEIVSGDSPGIVPDSPAERAGLKDGDIILEMGGERLSENRSLAFVIQKYNVGDRVSLKVQRDEQVLFISATLEERPESE
ncbi:MAG: trypsin-like peptidase domain-containing protein [Candidatus Colwellbacteria bacterium]|nr:trypsin-like peptidase domain-containing protein [Candidatus Colwellbacteria bacterium]